MPKLHQRLFVFIDELKVQIEENPTRRNVYFLSLLGTDSNEVYGKGIPRTNAFYFYDVKSRIELRRQGIQFKSAQDLQRFYEEQERKNGSKYDTKLNIYRLVEYFMEHNRDGYYFLDEVPLLQGGD